MKNELIEIKTEQGSQQWLSLRKHYVGSSDAASVMGVSKWSTEYQAWCEKLNLLPPKAENSPMTRGKELEPIARDLFEQITGIRMTPKVFVKDFMIASMDGVTNDNSIAVEIKCPNRNDHDLSLREMVPPHYFPQLQHQMMVLNIPEMYYFSYYHPTTEVRPFLVKRDEEYCEKLLDKERQFWNYVRTLESPPLSDRDYIERTDDAWVSKSLEWQIINRKMKNLEVIEDELRKELIEMAQGHNCKGAGLKISSSSRRGNIDYASIPELKNLDLEKYRKPKSVVWRLGEI